MTLTALDAFAPASAMLAALRDRQVTSAELVELHLQRIARYNPALNAVVVPGPDPLALGQEADRRLASGDSAALLGLPITLKESMNVKGMPVSGGVPEFAQYRSPETGAIAARVLGAGAVLLGKTNVPPMLSDWQSNNPIYGRTVNPWDPTRTPGGSTGGGAAAVAAGLSPLEFGSDIGGSIRVPAAFCGVFGHKPSETALPRSGQLPVPVRPNAAAVMGVQGPLARSAQDLDLALRVVAGPDVGEDVAWRLELPAPRADRLSDFRVAVLPAIAWQPIASDVQRALDAVVEQLSRSGAHVATAQPEAFGDMREHHSLYLSMLGAAMSARTPPEARELQAQLMQQHYVDADFVGARLVGYRATIADWYTWHAAREAYRAAYREFFKEWDVLLAPIVLCTAFAHYPLTWPPNETSMRQMLDIDGRAVPYERQLVYPGVATLSGQPATAFPAGLASDGLPIGLQAIGPYLEDRTPIHFAALLSRELGGFQAPPGY